MKIIKTNFEGLFLIKKEKYLDNRGEFLEIFRNDSSFNFENNDINFCQDNLVSSSINVLRGLHFQKNPYSQSKLITVIRGVILDVVVDLRPNSITYGEYFSIELSYENNLSLFVPNNFAHGYLSLTHDTLVHYKVDNYYNKKFESGIRFNDPSLKIDWGIKNDKIIISNRDKNFPDFKW
tara:strand:+ start:268 stop:804 length:537 start_codon:yes stop_codon:yes gene_type:complete